MAPLEINLVSASAYYVYAGESHPANDGHVILIRIHFALSRGLYFYVSPSAPPSLTCLPACLSGWLSFSLRLSLYPDYLFCLYHPSSYFSYAVPPTPRLYLSVSVSWSLCLCLSVILHRSLCLSVSHVSICICLSVSAYVSVCMAVSVYLSVSVSLCVCLFVYVCLSLSICVYLCPSVSLCICLPVSVSLSSVSLSSVSLSLYLCLYVSVFLFVSMSLYFCLSVPISMPLSLSLRPPFETKRGIPVSGQMEAHALLSDHSTLRRLGPTAAAGPTSPGHLCSAPTTVRHLCSARLAFLRSMPAQSNVSSIIDSFDSCNRS